MSQVNQPVSRACLQRLPVYLRYLQGKKEEGNISSAAIAEDLKLNAVLVRKDLACVSAEGGKPKTGYDIAELIACLERFLGYDNVTEAVLVGVGHLGTALLSYGGFTSCGLKIVMAFDVNPFLIGSMVGGRQIFDLRRLPELVARMKLKIGIVAVPGEEAQRVADLLVSAGVEGIWNFAPKHLTVPRHVVVKNEDLAASLAILTRTLAERGRPKETAKKEKKFAGL